LGVTVDQRRGKAVPRFSRRVVEIFIGLEGAKIRCGRQRVEISIRCAMLPYGEFLDTGW
jgi:hypothetical protein